MEMQQEKGCVYVCVCVLPGTSVGAGWSLSGWRPEEEGCWATGKGARRLLEPEPGRTPGRAHIQKQTLRIIKLRNQDRVWVCAYEIL